MADVSRGSLFEDVAVVSGVSGAIEEGMRRGSGVYVRAGPEQVAVWNVPTTHSHAQEPPERPRTLWRLPCAIVGRGLGRGFADGSPLC
jgi:hypothetical protein